MGTESFTDLVTNETRIENPKSNGKWGRKNKPEDKSDILYILEWKSKQGKADGKGGNYNSAELDQKVFNLKEQYPDLEYQIESVK